MLKKRLMMVMVVGMMAGTLATGCGSSAPMVEAEARTLPEDAMKDTVSDIVSDAVERAEVEEMVTVEDVAEPEKPVEADAEAMANDANTASNTPVNVTANVVSESKPVQAPIQAPIQAPKQEEPAREEVQPVHEHVWTSHHAVRQEWVPHVVTIDDYEPLQVRVANHWHCNCGAVVPEGSAAEHQQMHINAGEDDGGSYVPIYETQWVRVGSHEEDTGHFEDVDYVDYYECSCGATKQP